MRMSDCCFFVLFCDCMDRERDKNIIKIFIEFVVEMSR